MPKGILFVETRPTSLDREAEYNAWYDEVHLAEVLTVPGVVAARRYVSVRDDGSPFVAIYDLEAADLRDVIRAMRRTFAEHRFVMSDAVTMDPMPVMRLLELTTSVGPEAVEGAVSSVT